MGDFLVEKKYFSRFRILFLDFLVEKKYFFIEKKYFLVEKKYFFVEKKMFLPRKEIFLRRNEIFLLIANSLPGFPPDQMPSSLSQRSEILFRFPLVSECISTVTKFIFLHSKGNCCSTSK